MRRAAAALLTRAATNGALTSPALSNSTAAALSTSAARCATADASSADAAPIHISDEPFCRARSMMPLGPRIPTASPDAWVAPNAVVVGDVDLYDQVSVWHGAVLRGDLNHIRVGAGSTILDRAVLHAARSSPTGLPASTVVGKNVTVGERCLLRSATVGDSSVLGDGCILMEGSVVGASSVLAPGTVLPPGRAVPDGELWAGVPASHVRPLTGDEKAALPALAAGYSRLAAGAAVEELPAGGFIYRDAERVREVLAEAAKAAAGK